MPTPIERLQRAQKFLDSGAQKLQDDLAAYCHKAIVAQLLDWKKRYPRHDFHAWESHGMLAFEVYPPIMGETDPENLTMARVGRLCAITELAYEAREFMDHWNNMETKITSSPLTGEIRI